MRLLTAIVPLAAVLFAPSWLLADGCNPNTQDCGSYKDEASVAPRRAARAYSYAYTVRPVRGNWECPDVFDRRECRRIRREIELRRAREVRRTRSRYVEPAQYRRDYDDGRDERRSVNVKPSFGGKRCAGFFTVVGDARWTEGLARGSALKEWRKAVRTSERAGEQYVDERYSPNFRVGKCRIIGDRGINKRCTAEGIACRP